MNLLDIIFLPYYLTSGSNVDMTHTAGGVQFIQ